MKKFKTLFCLVLASSILTSSFCFSASAANFKKGSFTYYLNSHNNTATLVECDKTEFQTTITIPASVNGYKVVEISDNVFSNYDNANYIVMPNTTTTVGSYAFQKCSSLIEVTVPYSVTSMGTYVYYGCDSISSAYVSAQIEKLPDNTFYGCSSLEYVSLGTTIDIIGSAAFKDCTSLKTINLNEISEIGELAFYNSGLADVTIPETVTEIKRLSFANCEELERVTILESVTSISTDAFENCPKLTIVGYEGSYAQQYALDNNIPFEAIPMLIRGDVNLDGTVSVDDVTFLQMHVAKYNNFVSNDSYKVADFDNDGVINVTDVTMIQMYLAGYEV